MIVICIYIFFILVYGIVKKVNCFSSFQSGVTSTFSILLKIFPNMLACVFAVEIFINSGIISITKNLLAKSSFPPEIFLQTFFKPISSSSSLIMMFDIFNKYGTDSLYGQLSSIIQGCSETTFYVVSIYFASVRLEKTKYAVKVGLLTDIISFLIAMFFLAHFIK